MSLVVRTVSSLDSHTRSINQVNQSTARRIGPVHVEQRTEDRIPEGSSIEPVPLAYIARVQPDERLIDSPRLQDLIDDEVQLVVGLEHHQRGIAFH